MMVAKGVKMRIIKQEPMYCYADPWRIKPYFMEYDTADYLIGIQIGRMDYSWRIYKGNPTEVEILEWEDLYQR